MYKDLRFRLGAVVQKRAVPLLLVTAFMAGLLVSPALVGTGRAQPPESAAQSPDAGIVSLDPPYSETSVGTSASVDVRSDGAANIYGAQFTVIFDAANLQVVDADPDPGVQITPGSCPDPDFVAANAADNTTGSIDYAATQLAPTPPCDGGVIATIEFMCGVISDTFPITITESILSDPDGTPITHSVQHGQIRCIDNVFTIIGQAVPQAHSADAIGVEVCLDGGECVTTGADGSFSFTALADESHTVTADFEAHLLSQSTGITGSVGDVVDIGETTLHAGDLNGDGVINILDLVMVGGHFNESQPVDW